jgi:hypothetical protein
MSKHQVCIRDRRVMFLQRRLDAKTEIVPIDLTWQTTFKLDAKTSCFIILQETCQLSLLPT